jgi:hypothetical protein
MRCGDISRIVRTLRDVAFFDSDIMRRGVMSLLTSHNVKRQALSKKEDQLAAIP